MKLGKTTVATFSDRAKADAVQQRLIKAGIEADRVDESFYQRYWFVSKPLAFAKVYVPEADFDKSRALLQTADAQDHILQGEIKCPQCGSVRIDYPQFTRKFIMTAFVEVGCFLGITEKKFFCKSCNYTWPVKEPLRPKEDVMQWPTDGPMVREQKP